MSPPSTLLYILSFFPSLFSLPPLFFGGIAPGTVYVLY